MTADDGINGEELWKSDGTAAGTFLVKDINPNGDSSPDELTVFNQEIYFVADSGSSGDDGINGRELWKSDGTAGGTTLVRDINPNGSSFPNGLTVLNDSLYFSADDHLNGTELWQSQKLPLDTPIYRFQNSSKPGTYLFVGEEKHKSIKENFTNFVEEGFAFQVGVEAGDDLIPLYRFQSTQNPGTYLFAAGAERNNILENFTNFVEEGAAFEVGSGSSPF